MNIQQAKALAKYHKFTKLELYNILKDALADLPESYWTKPNILNKIFDNGYFFNACRDWIGYDGSNGSDLCADSITVRVLQVFGKYSKIQLPKKKKVDVKVVGSQKPSL